MMHFAAYLLNGRNRMLLGWVMMLARFNLYFAVMSWQKQLRNMAPDVTWYPERNSI